MIDKAEVNVIRGSAYRDCGGLSNIYPRQTQAEWSKRTQEGLLIKVDALTGLNISSTSIPYQEPVVARSVSINTELGTENMEVDIMSRGSRVS